MKHFLGSFLLTAMAVGQIAFASDLPVPKDLKAVDHPWDKGDKLELTWSMDEADAAKVGYFMVYRNLTEAELEKEVNDVTSSFINKAKSEATNSVLASARVEGKDPASSEVLEAIRTARQEAAAKGKMDAAAYLEKLNGTKRFKFLDRVEKNQRYYLAGGLTRGTEYVFKVESVGNDGTHSLPGLTETGMEPHREGFDGTRFMLGVFLLLIGGSVVYYIQKAKSGIKLNVRKIGGLEAVDAAVGRATEMGRSVLFVAGTQDINDIQTIAGITVLSRVSKTAAEYGAKVEVPTSRSLVMTAARETVQASYLAVGAPDAFNKDLIYYVTDEQFGYVAYLSGMMVREKPAACFYMGAFFAESLILAETGNSIGAIQVAGTAQPAQLPFFVAACDYTLIGEEFFAASAYLSGEPEQLGSLKGQDIGKILCGALIIIGVTMATLATVLGPESGLGTSLNDAVNYLKTVVLT